MGGCVESRSGGESVGDEGESREGDGGDGEMRGRGEGVVEWWRESRLRGGGGGLDKMDFEGGSLDKIVGECVRFWDGWMDR